MHFAMMVAAHFMARSFSKERLALLKENANRQ